MKLESVQSAEFVCSKAIRDGVIDAVIDHDKGWMQSQEVVDVYATDEPQQVGGWSGVGRQMDLLVGG